MFLLCKIGWNIGTYEKIWYIGPMFSMNMQTVWYTKSFLGKNLINEKKLSF